jgi:hypothetical protein
MGNGDLDTGVVGTCKLCLSEGELRQSHLWPAALYALIKKTEDESPVVMTPKIVLATDRQIWSHLLCGDCEQRLNKYGETYAMSVLQRENAADFKLLSILDVALPFWQQDPLTVRIPVHVNKRSGKL